jgi:hypothetical protein
MLSVRNMSAGLPVPEWKVYGGSRWKIANSVIGMLVYCCDVGILSCGTVTQKEVLI